MLYVQFDKLATDAARATPPGDAILCGRVRRLHDVFAGLQERKAEPAVALLRFATLLAFGEGALTASTWQRRGLDTARGFSLAVLARDWDGRFPLGLAAETTHTGDLLQWLGTTRLTARTDGERVAAGHRRAAEHARALLDTSWPSTLASDDPYAELVGRFGFTRRSGGFWVAASRRDERFQVEVVVALPGLPPLHAIARDPPVETGKLSAQNLPPLHQIGATAPLPGILPAQPFAPPSWDEPGPCDCGIAPDECVMKRFRLTPYEGVAESAVPAADTFRQLTASLLDLREIRVVPRGGPLRVRDRVLVAAAAESRRALKTGDFVLAPGGEARVYAAGEPGLPILSVVPWPRSLSSSGLGETFSLGGQ